MYYCSKFKLNKPITNALDSLNIGITQDISKTQLYFPCGYNKVEVELNKIRFINDIPLIQPQSQQPQPQQPQQPQQLSDNNKKQNLTNLNNKFENKVILGISGCDKLCSKNDIWSNLKKNYSIEKASNIMPMTFIINNKKDMLMLRDIENEHMTNPLHKSVYILKNNNQGKRGLYLTNNIHNLLNTKKIKEYKVIQKYLINPYLINKRKLNIRLYVLILNIKDNPTEWYLYNSGKCIYNNKDYDPNTSLLEHNLQDKEQHFTSLNLNSDYIYNKLKNPETLEQLHTHLGDDNYNFLMYKIINKLRDIKFVYNNEKILNNKDNLLKNITMQYFGIDIIMDENLEPYILEFNKGPEMTYKAPNDKLLKDTFVYKVFNISKKLYKGHYRTVNSILESCFTKC
jgi:hypothetical protein